MIKKLLLSVLAVCALIAVFSVTDEETAATKAQRTAAQCFRRIHYGDASNPEGQTILGYYKDMPITRDQVDYMRAMNRFQQDPEHPTRQNPEMTEHEAVFAVARDLFTDEQVKELGLYPSEERIEEIRASEWESFQKNPEENLKFCSQVRLTQEQMNEFMVQLKIDSMTRGGFIGQKVAALVMGEENIEDEALAELCAELNDFYSGGEENNAGSPAALIPQIYDRYVTLQIGDQITYLNKDSGAAAEAYD